MRQGLVVCNNIYCSPRARMSTAFVYAKGYPCDHHRRLYRQDRQSSFLRHYQVPTTEGGEDAFGGQGIKSAESGASLQLR